MTDLPCSACGAYWEEEDGREFRIHHPDCTAIPADTWDSPTEYRDDQDDVWGAFDPSPQIATGR